MWTTEKIQPTLRTMKDKTFDRLFRAFFWAKLDKEEAPQFEHKSARVIFVNLAREIWHKVSGGAEHPIRIDKLEYN